MIVQFLVDDIDSWIVPYILRFKTELSLKEGLDVRLVHEHEKVEQGDVLFLLGCRKKYNNLILNSFNLVIHESELPKGKGWSPLTWQILEGKKQIVVSLFEAEKDIDSGKIYFQDTINFEGHELLPELKQKQWNSTKRLINKVLTNYPSLVGFDQEGTSTYFEKRTPKDSELNISKSIDDQFNLLRICDNERYPAYFKKNGIKYYIKIEKE